MSSTLPPSLNDEAQRRYARWLALGSRAGLALLVLSFVAYLAGWIPPLVPLDVLPQRWNQPVRAYLQATGQASGWGWLAQAGHGDVLNLVGIALLASCSLPCLLAVLPCYRRAGDRAFVAICLLEVGVLAFAASGIVGGGH